MQNIRLFICKLCGNTLKNCGFTKSNTTDVWLGKSSRLSDKLNKGKRTYFDFYSRMIQCSM